MKKLIPNICLILLAVLLSTCKKDHLFDCLTSTGKEVTRYREAKSFTRINMRDNVDLVIRHDASFYIKVTAGEHLIDGIITELSGQTLYIRNENKCNWVRSFGNKYTVEIGVDSLTKIDDYGSGAITCLDTLRSTYFAFDSWNASGDISLLLQVNTVQLVNNTGRISMHAAGRTGVSYIYFNDTGVFDGSTLETNVTYIRSSTTGACRIFADDEIGVEIKYVGSIYYRGNPTRISQTITGSGRLIKE